MCIVQRWRGEAPTERTFYEGNHARDPMYLGSLPRTTVHAFGPDEEREIELALRIGSLVAVTVMAHDYAWWIEQTHPDLHSSFGALTGFLHIVVLMERVRDGYLLLDPYYARDGQPITASDDAFARWFAGHAFVAAP